MSIHSEWLSLLDISGPFLAEPVLESHFPQGLDQLNPIKKKRIRQAYEEWRDAKDNDDPLMAELHKAWIDLVLKQGLELDEDDDEDVLKPASKVNEIKYEALEHGVVIRPTYAVVAGDNKPPSMYVEVLSPEIDLEAVNKQDGWSASPAERMLQLCRANKVRLGLLTNGEQWMLIDAPEGGVTTYASWYARIWSQEPITLQAFVTLLSIRRFFLDESQQLPALIDESLKHQDEVTDALGDQVRRAVEVLVQALDKADQDRDRELLKDVEPSELYEAGLTVMMRLVFLLSAEERALLPVDSLSYESYYAVSTLRMQLRDQAGIHSEEILSHRRDAWSRLLAIFRAVYGGVDHETLSMPALGGSLFDPDRFPFLEGREKGSNWRRDPARPLPIDNRTVLLLLDAIQLFQGRTLSYRALDIEQIGYVYEGLLERTVVRAKDITLELDATKKSKQPWVTWGELEDTKLNGDKAVEDLLVERTGSSASRVKNDLKKPVTDAQKERLLTVCQGDQALRDRLAPYYHLLRIDPWEYPLIYPKGAFMVATGTDRRETGTHYTPKSLTESIVKETLEPVVYVGPAEGAERKDWQLKSPREILDLKVCDLAMGSGAFLVQVCRWLSERLSEAWSLQEAQGKQITSEGLVVNSIKEVEPLTNDAEERSVVARRLISERCLYGVDVNPLAVELAKLSIWLITLAKGRPFGFLDHNLRHGDSLLGITNLDQLYYLDMNVGTGSAKKLFAQKIEEAVKEAIDFRLELRNRPILDIRDVEVMAHLDQKARQQLELPELIADALVGETLVSGGKKVDTTSLSIEAGRAFEGNSEAIGALEQSSRKTLSTDLPTGKLGRRAFHWCLEFPEVFGSENPGFDAIVGNPPFLGGTRISGALGGVYRDFVSNYLSEKGGGQADLVAYFFVQAENLVRSNGCFGLLSTNSISEGDTRQAGLEPLLKKENVKIICAYPRETWPGKAAVITSRVHIFKGNWKGEIHLDQKNVSYISAFLSDREEWSLKELKENSDLAFEGTYTFGNGFTLSEHEAKKMIQGNEQNRKVLFPYINGKELNGDPLQQPGRWVVNFYDWSEDDARNYNLPYEKLLNDVKVDRQTTKNKQVREYPWWLHWRPRPALYHAIGRGAEFNKHPPGWDKSLTNRPEQVLASCRVSKHPIFCFIPNHYIYSNAINIFALEKYSEFACLQSSIHSCFIWKYASRMKNDIRYTPGDVFMPFPFPRDLSEIEAVGLEYHSVRKSIMERRNIGLTKVYNEVHSTTKDSEDLVSLRNLRIELDYGVLCAYGWDDISLDHNFHEVEYLPENDPVRFTISEEARKEILYRLAMLNKERYEKESANKAKVTPIKKYSNKPMRDPALDKVAEPKPQRDFFSSEDE